MRHGSILLLRFILGGLLLSAATAVAAPGDEQAAADRAPQRKDKIYYFEHRLLPRLTHQTKGGFYADLRRGDLQKFEDMARKIVDLEFAANLGVHPAGDLDGIVITFPRPTEIGHCYWVAIVRSGEGFRYLTFEFDEDILNAGIKGSTCEWTPDGAHKNFGPSKDADEASFLKTVAKLMSAGNAER